MKQNNAIIKYPSRPKRDTHQEEKDTKTTVICNLRQISLSSSSSNQIRQYAIHFEPAIAEDNFIDAFSSFPLSAHKRGTSTGYRKTCLMSGVCLCLLSFTHSQCSQVRFQNLVCGRPVFQFLFHACDRIASESCALACTATRESGNA
jgi:hypothetical protein